MIKNTLPLTPPSEGITARRPGHFLKIFPAEKVLSEHSLSVQMARTEKILLITMKHKVCQRWTLEEILKKKNVISPIIVRRLEWQEIMFIHG